MTDRVTPLDSAPLFLCAPGEGIDEDGNKVVFRRAWWIDSPIPVYEHWPKPTWTPEGNTDD